MGWLNEYGVDPSKLTKQQLVNEIIYIGDFYTMGDCIDYLYEIDRELATESLLRVMTTNTNAKNYGDRFYQAMFLGIFFSRDKDMAITYISDNYDKMEILVLAVTIEKLTNVEGGKFDKIRNKLKLYLANKGEDYFQELKDDLRFKDVREEFLDSFK